MQCHNVDRLLPSSLSSFSSFSSFYSSLLLSLSPLSLSFVLVDETQSFLQNLETTAFDLFAGQG